MTPKQEEQDGEENRQGKEGHKVSVDETTSKGNKKSMVAEPLSMYRSAVPINGVGLYLEINTSNPYYKGYIWYSQSMCASCLIPDLESILHLSPVDSGLQNTHLQYARIVLHECENGAWLTP